MTTPEPVLPTKPFGTSAWRDQLTALVICAAIVVALVVAYRPASGPSQTAEVPAATAAVVAVAEPFDLNTALRLAGEQVPPETESFYFFAYTDAAPAAQEIAELGDKLVIAAQEHDFVGIAGPDPERNRRNLLGALTARTAQELQGTVVIYVGPASQQTELTGAALAAGIELRYVVYPAPKPAI